MGQYQKHSDRYFPIHFNEVCTKPNDSHYSRELVAQLPISNQLGSLKLCIQIFTQKENNGKDYFRKDKPTICPSKPPLIIRVSYSFSSLL